MHISMHEPLISSASVKNPHGRFQFFAAFLTLLGFVVVVFGKEHFQNETEVAGCDIFSKPSWFQADLKNCGGQDDEVEAFLKRFDQNEDGSVTQSEINKVCADDRSERRFLLFDCICGCGDSPRRPKKKLITEIAPVKPQCSDPVAAHGASEKVERYRMPWVYAPATCKKQTRTRECLAGKWSKFDGMFKYEACQVRPMPPMPPVHLVPDTAIPPGPVTVPPAHVDCMDVATLVSSTLEHIGSCLDAVGKINFALITHKDAGNGNGHNAKQICTSCVKNQWWSKYIMGGIPILAHEDYLKLMESENLPDPGPFPTVVHEDVLYADPARANTYNPGYLNELFFDQPHDVVVYIHFTFNEERTQDHHTTWYRKGDKCFLIHGWQDKFTAHDWLTAKPDPGKIEWDQMREHFIKSANHNRKPGGRRCTFMIGGLQSLLANPSAEMFYDIMGFGMKYPFDDNLMPMEEPNMVFRAHKIAYSYNTDCTQRVNAAGLCI